MAAVYPVPELMPTLEELRRVTEFLLDPPEYQNFLALLQDLSETVLPEIQEEFKQTIKDNSNWFNEYFLSTILSVRDPIPVSSALVSLLTDDALKREVLSRATSLLVAIGQMYTDTHDIQKFTSSLVKQFGRESDQELNLLAACRIPGKEKDDIVMTKDSKHVLVINKGKSFKVDILDSEGVVFSDGVIRQQLNDIIQGRKTSDTNDVLALTGLPRRDWFEARERHLMSPSTSENLHKIESAIVAITLEEKRSPEKLTDRLQDVRLGEAGSRYYDKIVNLVVYAGGEAGIIINHSCADGFKAIMFTQILFQLAKELELNEMIRQKRVFPEYLDLSIKDSKSDVHVHQFDRQVVSFEVPVPRDTLSVIQEAHMRDGWLMLSLQLALSDTKNTSSLLLVEPTCMGNFKYGRTDPTYPVNKKSRDFIAAQKDKKAFPNLLARCQSALEEHNYLIKKTEQGQAFGPHLSALRGMLKAKLPNHPILKYLACLSVPDVIMTGSGEEWDGIHSGMANLFSADQLVVNYFVKYSSVLFVTSARGKMAQILPDLRSVFVKSIENMINLTLPLATREIMLSNLPVKTASVSAMKECQNETWAIALHAGAGGTKTALHQCSAGPRAALFGGAGGGLETDAKVNDLLEYALQSALQLGSDLLKAGHTSLDVVELVTASLENCFLFNAGKGAVYNCNGSHELEAAIVDGDRGLYGAMGYLTNVKNPISGARLVMEKTPHCIIVGDSAESICAKEGMESVPNTYFNTDFRRTVLKQIPEERNELQPQTVGVVALDRRGKLSASSSTGGLRGKMKGRIGDSLINGAGLTATKECAVTCTGQGEVFLRKCVASSLVCLMNIGMKTLHDACKETVSSCLCGSEGGLIAVDKSANLVCEFSSENIMVGMADSKGMFQAKVLTKTISPPMNNMSPKSGTNAP